MSGTPRSRNDWLTPQNMLTAAAMLWGMYGSYTAFQRDTGKEMSSLRTDIEVLKVKVGGCANGR